MDRYRGHYTLAKQPAVSDPATKAPHLASPGKVNYLWPQVSQKCRIPSLKSLRFFKRKCEIWRVGSTRLASAFTKQSPLYLRNLFPN